MKKTYLQPCIAQQYDCRAAFPLVAPLAFFSASTAAAAAVGAGVGAVATKKLIRATPNESKNAALQSVCK